MRPSATCGICAACVAGRHDACERRTGIGMTQDGAFAPSVRVPQRNCVPVPDTLSDELAALGDVMAPTVEAATALLALSNDVDSAVEAAYNEWHAVEHVPERCTVPGGSYGADAGIRGHLLAERIRDASPLPWLGAGQHRGIEGGWLLCAAMHENTPAPLAPADASIYRRATAA